MEVQDVVSVFEVVSLIVLSLSMSAMLIVAAMWIGKALKSEDDFCKEEDGQ